jgi:group I intron endonuclease
VVAGIYAIQNKTTGEQYIGSSGDVGRRLKRHLMTLGRGGHSNPRLQAAWDRFGSSAFRLALLLRCAKEQLHGFEQTYLDLLAPAYNLSPIAAPNRLRGTVRGPETRRRMGDAKRGTPKGPEHRAKLSAALIGNRNALGNKARLGRPHTEASKAKMRKPKPPRSIEHCQKMREAGRRGAASRWGTKKEK